MMRPRNRHPIRDEARDASAGRRRAVLHLAAERAVGGDLDRQRRDPRRADLEGVVEPAVAHLDPHGKVGSPHWNATPLTSVSWPT